MRLGEIKKNIEKVLNEENKIQIQHEPAFGGQAESVSNFNELIDVLKILFNESWNNFDYEPIEKIINTYGKQANPVILSQEEFNQLDSYISQINSLIHLYFSILEVITEDQEEQIINIQLPTDSIGSLGNLANLNKRLDDIFKKFNIDGGEVRFKGFDKGTDWYMVIFVGVLSYQSFIACLKIAKEYFKLKTEYYKSKRAELDYKASLQKDEDFSDDNLEKYTKRRLDLLIEDKVSEAMDNIAGTNGKTPDEMCSQLVIATKNLVKELGDGVEFHLSLNPPIYANEFGGKLKIDYRVIKEIREEKNKPKQLKKPQEEKTK